MTVEETMTALRACGSDDDLRRVVSDLEVRLAEKRRSVVILGEFNRGKSSLINLLLGDEILPVDVVPTTPTVVALRWGSGIRATLHEADGSSRGVAVDSETLARLQTEESGGAGSGGLRMVEIEHPGAPLGYTIIDTPGVNDLGETDPTLVYAVLPWVDVAVIVMDASIGVTHSDIVFIKERLLRTVRPRLLFLVNKVDRIVSDGDDEMQEVQAHFRSEIAGIIGTAPEMVFGVTLPCHPDRARTRTTFVEALARASDVSNDERSQRLFQTAAVQLAAIADRVREEVATTSEEAHFALGRLDVAMTALDDGFRQFREHVIAAGQDPLAQMIERSLDHLRDRLTSDIERRIAMTGSSVVAYAEHGLSPDVAAGVQAWADSHVREVHGYLRRHRAFVAVEFERNFGAAFPLHRAAPIAVTLSGEFGGTVDASGLLERERTLTLMRFGLPAVGGLVLGMVASPLAVAGLAAGYIIADTQRKRTEEEARSELRIAARGLVSAATERVRTEMRSQVQAHFAGLSRLLEAAFQSRAESSRAELSRHAESASSDTAAARARLHKLDTAVTALRTEG